MVQILTVKRPSPLNVIYIPVMVADPATEQGGQVTAELDTGNDHTCIRRDILTKLGILATGRNMHMQGVTGSAVGVVTKLFLGFKMDDGSNCCVENHEVVVLDHMSVQCLLGRDILRIFDVELLKNGTAILKYA